MDWQNLREQADADAFLDICIVHDAALCSVHFDVANGEPTSAVALLETRWGAQGRYALRFDGVKAIRINGDFDTRINEMSGAILKVAPTMVLFAEDDNTVCITARTCAWRKCN